MFAKRSQRAKALGILGAAVMAVGIGAWTLPSGPAKEGQARTLSFDINWPAGQIQDGQFCQAYAVVYSGTGPYTFTWSGQFDNSYGSTGGLGANQIVSGNTTSARGDSLTLWVKESTGDSASVTRTWNWGDFNDECSI